MIVKNIKKGFSLVELLVVITIIAILSVVAYTAIGGQTIKAKNSRRLQDLNTLQQALELYFVKNNVYPVNLAGMGKDIINKIPVDPNDSSATPKPYFYLRGNEAGGDTDSNRTYVLATIQDAVEQDDDLKSYVTTNDENFDIGSWTTNADSPVTCSVNQDNAHESTICFPYLP